LSDNPRGLQNSPNGWSQFDTCNLQNLNRFKDRGVIFGEDYIFSAVAV